MTISTLGQELKIICGVPRAPGDTASAEDALQILDLLAGTKGFSVEPGGWIPQLPQVKNGGLWADSGVADGRTLMAAPVGNVTESISLTSNAATLQGRYYWEKELSRFSKLCADFWQTFGQIQPVYLKWWAPDAPGPQYALLYKIELAARSDPFSGDSVQEMVVSVEREPYWRGIAPGDNPKKWTFEFRGELATVTVRDFDLGPSSTRNLADANVQNRREWDTTTALSISQNWVEISGDNIPGDAPALVCLTTGLASSVNNEGLTPDRVFLARSTKPTSLPTGKPNNPGLSRPVDLQFYNLNAGDSNGGIDFTVVADANAPVSHGSAAGQRGNISFATATMQPRVAWGSSGNYTWLDASTLRGRYAVYLRARASAVGVIHAYVEVRGGAGGGSNILNLPTVTIQQGVGGTPSWYLHYMGMVDIPFWSRVGSNLAGLGLEVTYPGTTNLYITLYAERTSGAASLYVADLVLMPMDEAMLYIDQLIASYPAIDNTGYLGHGSPGEKSGAYATVADADIPHNVTALIATTQLVGSPLTLLPGVTNRIYYLAQDSSKGSPIGMNLKLHLNIVPRWAGARDR